MSAMLALIDRYEERFVLNKFQRLVTTLYEEQCDIVFSSTRTKFGVENSGYNSVLRECECAPHEVCGEGPEEREGSMANEAESRS